MKNFYKKRNNLQSILILPMLLLAITAAGQDATRYIDSITQGLNERQKLEVLNKQAVEVRASDLILGTAIADHALKLARRLNDKKLLATAILNQGTIYYFTSDYDSAQRYWEDALNRFTEIRDSLGIGFANMNMGVLCQARSEYNKAIYYNQVALGITLRNNDTLKALGCMQNIANSYFYLGKYEDAYHQYQQIIDMNAAFQYPDVIVSTLIQMAALFERQDEFELALAKYNEALALADSLSLARRTAIILRNMGVIYIQTGENMKALDHLFGSLYIRDSLGLKQGYASTLSIIGKVYELEGNLQRANEMYVESLKISEANDNKKEVSDGLRFIGENLLLSNNIASAEGYVRKSLEVAHLASLPLQVSENYKLLTFIFAATNQLDSAKEYIDKYAELKMQLKMDFDEEEENPSDLESQETDNGLMTTSPSNGLVWLVSLIIITGLVVFIFILLSFLLSRRQQRNKFYRKIN